jgi:hypothetical protein
MLITVEYDLNFYGGDYAGQGEFVEIAVNDGNFDEDEAIELAFEKQTGYSSQHIISYNLLEEKYLDSSM